MTEVFAELPFNIVPSKNFKLNPVEEIINFVESHEEYRFNKEIIDIVYKYLGIYLQLIYRQIYKLSGRHDEYFIPVKRNLQKGEIDYVDLTDIIDENGNTLLHHFAMMGHYDLVELLLTKYKIEPEIHNYGIDHDTDMDDPGKTALMCIVEKYWNTETLQKYLDICVLLVRNKADWTQIFRLIFWSFHYAIHLKIKKNNKMNHIEKNIIELIYHLKKLELIDINSKCVRETSKKFGRLTDPEHFGRRIYFYNIDIYYSWHFAANKKYRDPDLRPILFLAILTKNKPIIDCLFQNGAEMENYKQYDGLEKDYIEGIRKQYNYLKRKAFLEAFDGNHDIKYLSNPYQMREIASYL